MQRIPIFVTSIPEFQKFGFLALWAHNTTVALKICYGSSVSEDFGTSGLRVSGFRFLRLPDLLSFPTSDFRNSDLLYPLGPHNTTVSTSTVVSGTLRWVHVTYDDVIGSHHSRLSPRLTGTWYTHVSTSVQKEKSNG
jgi:hypothetical protein